MTIGGSLVGGSRDSTGVVASQIDLGPVRIGGDFIGGSISGTASLLQSGFIGSAGRIASVTIGGSIISGIDDSTGSLNQCATIIAVDDLGAVIVRGSIVGNRSPQGDSPVVICARGQANPGATTDLAIGRISVGGRVEFARVLAGYDVNLTPVNGDASIGLVTVGGDWIASSLVAGVTNAASGNTNFGDGNDAAIGTGRPGVTSRIVGVVIGGQVVGTPSGVSLTDQFGFSAQRVGHFQVGGLAMPLTQSL